MRSLSLMRINGKKKKKKKTFKNDIMNDYLQFNYLGF